MFKKLRKGDLVLRPEVIHGQRNDRKPVVYYIRSQIDDVSQGVIVVNGKQYCTKAGAALGACDTLPLRVFIHSLDQTKERDQYLKLMKNRRELRATLSSDDVIDSLGATQIYQIQSILRLNTSRRR